MCPSIFPSARASFVASFSQVRTLEAHGIVSGVNLLVARSGLAAAGDALVKLEDSGIGLNRIVLLPMRGQDTPSAAELARIAGHRAFQSMTCLGLREEPALLRGGMGQDCGVVLVHGGAPAVGGAHLR